MKKHTLLAIIFLFIYLGNSFGQSIKITQQEKTVESATGVYKVQSLIKLSELWIAEDFYKKAIKPARAAKKLALELGQKEMAAIAMNREGKATYSSKTIRARRKGEKLMQESLEILPNGTNPNLRIENLELLEKYSRLRGDVVDSYRYKKKLAVLKGLPIPEPPEVDDKRGGLFKDKKREMIEQISEEKAELSDSIKNIAANAEKLKLETNIMNRAIDYQQKRITNLSKSQMEQELEIAEQKRLVDSLNFARVLDSFKLNEQMVVLKEQNMELREKEMEISLKNSQRNFWLVLAMMGLLLGLGLWSRYSSIKSYSNQLEEKNVIIEKERERSDELLLNILPESVAQELKTNGAAKARKYEMASVLFTDFVGFSTLAHEMAPEVLVFELDFYFKKFDEIIAKHGLEKIKTIGDSYMCAGGLPNLNGQHPLQIVRAAVEIQKFVKKWKAHKHSKGEVFFEARIGVHSGPVVAGVVGEKKYAYDIWGDTVNIASRLERNCEPGQVNISKATYELVKGKIQAESRGKIQAKNIGEIEMFYIKF